MRTGPKLILTAIGIYLLLLLLEKGCDFGLRHNQNLKLTAISSSPARAAILFHGPCEPLWMIAPAQLDSITGTRSYNLALSHSDFADNYLHLYMYLQFNKPPGHLFLYITPESMDRRYNTFNSYRFAAYLNDREVRQVVRENDPGYEAWCWMPFMRYAYYNNKISFEVLQGYKHFFEGKKEAYYPDGFEPPANRVWGNHAAGFAELYDRNNYFAWDALREKYLLKTIRLAREKGVRVHLYESPVFEGALAWQPNRGDMIGRIRDLAESEQVDFIQFKNMPMAAKKELYISTLNFNMAGLRLFNDTLGRYIRKNILKADTAR